MKEEKMKISGRDGKDFLKFGTYSIFIYIFTIQPIIIRYKSIYIKILNKSTHLNFSYGTKNNEFQNNYVNLQYVTPRQSLEQSTYAK